MAGRDIIVFLIKPVYRVKETKYLLKIVLEHNTQ